MSNRFTKARESLQWLIHSARLPPAIVRDTRWIDQLLHESVKFSLPLNGNMIDNRHLTAAELLSLGRLPFPIVAVEFDIDPADYPLFANAPYLAVGRLALAVDLSHPEGRARVAAHWPGFITHWDRAFGVPGPHGTHSPAEGVMIVSIDDARGLPESVRSTVNAEWIPGLHVAFLPYDQTPAPTDEQLWHHSEVLRDSEGPRRPFSALLMLRRLGLETDAQPPMTTEDLARFGAELSVEIQAIAELVALSQCRNVRYEKTAAPVALQRRRAQRGRLPLYDLHTLVLDAGEAHASGSTGSGASTGRSVATHIRRGHIRRLASGLTWVRSTVVAPFNARTVEKTYAVRRAPG